MPQRALSATHDVRRAEFQPDLHPPRSLEYAAAIAHRRERRGDVRMAQTLASAVLAIDATDGDADRRRMQQLFARCLSREPTDAEQQTLTAVPVIAA